MTPLLRSAPGRLPLLGHVPALAWRRQHFIQGLRHHGDVVEVYLGRRPAYLINSPALLRQVLVSEARNVERGRLFDKAREFAGNGIGTSSGAVHLRQRRMIQPAFHRDRFPGYARLIRAAAEEKVESWQPGQAFAVDRDMHEVGLMAVTRTLFSTHLSAANAATVHQSLPILVQGLMRRTLLPFDALEKLPTTGNRRFTAARKGIQRVLDEVIATYRADSTDRSDLVSVLKDAKDPDTGAAMTDRQLRDEAMSILVAASETTGHALNSLLYELARNPAVEALVHAELKQVLGGRPIEYDDIAKLTYLGRVVKESLRLHNPMWLLMRRTNRPVDLGGTVTLPSGADLLLSLHTMHRDPELYPDPLRFDPDRWLSVEDTPRSRDAYVPFLIGPHRCIGEFFALMELPIVLATIMTRWRLRLADTQPVREVADTLVHLDTLRMIATARG